MKQYSYKHSSFLVVLIPFLLMWILAGWNTYNEDFLGYEETFDSAEAVWDYSTGLDFGYLLINNIIRSSGFTFIQFRQIIYFVFLLFVVSYIYKKSHKPFLICMIYISVIFFRDAILCRNTLAMIPMYIGLSMLVQENTTKSKAIFLICNTIACTIHASFVYYFIFLLLDKKFNPYFTFVVFFVASLFGELFLTNLLDLSVLSGNEAVQQRSVYITESSWLSLLASSISVFLNYFVLCHFIEKKEMRTEFDQRVLNISVLLMSILLFTYVSMEFARLFRNLFLFFCIININNFLCIKRHSFFSILLLLFWIGWELTWITILTGVGPQVKMFFIFNPLINSF